MTEDIRREIADLRGQLDALDLARHQIAKKLESLEFDLANQAPLATHAATGEVTGSSSSSDKIRLMRSLFRGREDVFPRRWQSAKSGKSGYSPACRNEWVHGLCAKPQIKCAHCTNQAFVPVDDGIVRSHLSGRTSGGSAETTIGVYALLPHDTCWFLAIDFDKHSWMEEISAFRQSARANGVPVAIERSRSGNGAHAWIFFTEPVPASQARRLGTLLISETLDRYPDLGFDSYDRMFPSQDTMPIGGFGNLIALPLQNRARQDGNSVFVDDSFNPFQDQWAYLSSTDRISRDQLDTLVREADSHGKIIGIALPSANEEAEEPWTALPSHRNTEAPINEALPKTVSVVIANQIYLDRESLPPVLISRIVRLAAFQNPEFYSAQAMRLPTFDKPRVISCAQLLPRYVAIPRGCLDNLLQLLADVGIQPEIRDERQHGQPLETQFLGKLTTLQDEAVAALLDHDTGVLAATTAFGKTVVGAKMIAARGRNTLVLVHRKYLAEQWMAQLQAFLDVAPEEIGVYHGTKKKLTGVVDIAVMQSLVQKGVVSDLVADYGHLIVDECHHISAVSFEALAREAKAEYVLGLSATVTRKDGHHPIIFMQCGPVRYRVDAKKQAESRPFDHKVVFRHTQYQPSRSNSDERPKIQELYASLSKDLARNSLIIDDVIAALKSGRSPVVITERKDHLEFLANRLSEFSKNVIVLRGGMTTGQARSAANSLREISPDEERVIVATGRYLGEGFDDARLDTLFITMPISWRGTLAQYAGRLHRLHQGKQDVVIYDYVDHYEPMLVKMAAKREAGYRSLGYEAVPDKGLSPSGS